MDLPLIRRLLWVHAEEFLERQPAALQREARDLYAQGKYEINNEIVDDYFAPDSGLNYILSVLPDGRAPIRLARLPWHKLALADRGLLDTLEQAPPDNPASLTEDGDTDA
jgi:hypothetical protein